jgi:hypothetical protein
MTPNSNITRRMTGGVLLLMVLMGVRGDLFACGDKFLVVSRGTRFDHPAARLAARILIYAKPGTGMATSLGNGPVEATLSKAGYLPTTVTSPQALERELATGEWALVLADLADVQDVRARFHVATSPMLLAVFDNPSGDAMKAAKKQYQHVLKMPAKSRALLDAIDEALAVKSIKTIS